MFSIEEFGGGVLGGRINPVGGSGGGAGVGSDAGVGTCAGVEYAASEGRSVVCSRRAPLYSSR